MGIQHLFDPTISDEKKQEIARDLLKFFTGVDYVPPSKQSGSKRIKSEDIFGKIFKEWVPLSEVEKNGLPSTVDFVYAFRLKNRTLETANGKSTPYVYLGHTTNLERRIINEYIHGNGGKTSKRIHNLLINKNYKEKVELSYRQARGKESSVALENELRTLFYSEYDQLPIWNRQE